MIRFVCNCRRDGKTVHCLQVPTVIIPWRLGRYRSFISVRVLEVQVALTMSLVQLLLVF
jgi:hypothetical protein